MKRDNRLSVAAALCAVLIGGVCRAGGVSSDMRFEAAADHTNCLYACGETAAVTVCAKDAEGRLLRCGRLSLTVDNFGAAVVTNRTVDLACENPFTVRLTRANPGFSRLTVSSNFTWGVGFDVAKIRPGTPYPDDFMDFWRAAIAKYDREIPNDIALRTDDALSDDTWIVERLTMSAFGDRKVYGYVTRERTAEGRLPAVVCVPGAGYGGWSQAPAKVPGHVTMMVAVLPFEPDANLGRLADYKAANAAAQAKWGVETYAQGGISDSREAYFFYPVILAVNRAVDWFAVRPDVDATRIRYNGTSQGGGMGLALMALNRHFAYGSVFVPALTDLLGFRVGGRKSGWPTLVEVQRPENKAAAEKNAPYFCGVNFARQIRVPIGFAVGYADVTCPPNAVYSAHNVCPSAEKTIVGGVGMGHSVNAFCHRGIEAWEKRFSDGGER